MKKNLLMPINLQFFGEEGAGVEVSEAAEPTETNEVESSTTTEDDSSTESEDSNVQSAEENAKYAAARRRAEAEFAKYKANEDAEYARRFGDYTNPITHQPIRSKQDYFDALDAQEKLKRDAELESKGIDPNLFEQMVNRQVANNPYVMQAQAIMQANQEQQIQNQLADDMKAITKLNPNLKTLDDVFALDNAQEMIDMVQKNNISLANAYKLTHFDDLMAGKTASAKQAALNTMNGTSHLNQTDSLAASDNGEVEIPANELDQWKRAFPHASMAELRKKYNSSL